MDHLRHIGIFDAGGCTATVIGAGGIGAITTVVLAKMGVPYITVWDDDVIDDVNLATQFYRISDLGQNKVDALGQIVQSFSDDTEYHSYCERVQGENAPIANIIISGVDSIESRKNIWQTLGDLNSWDWYLDARMGAEIFHLYSVRFDDREWYNAALGRVSEDDVVEAPCTSKATIYTAAIAAGQIGMAVRDIVTGNSLPRLLVHDIKARNIICP